MPYLFSIVGASDSGKTSVACAIVEELSRRGVSVATIKHAPKSHSAPPPGTDSERLFEAGASPSMAVSPGEATSRERLSDSSNVTEIVYRTCWDADVVIAEGFKSSDLPKIMIHGGNDDIEAPSGLFAHVGTELIVHDGLPVFEPTSDGISALSDLVIEQQRRQTNGSLIMTVDGRPVELGSFPARALRSVIEGFAGALKGIPADGESISIHLRRD